MADIYAKTAQPLEDIRQVKNFLSKHDFRADRTDIAFCCAFSRLAQFLHLNEDNTALFACLFAHYFEMNEKPMTLATLAESMDTSAMRLLAFRACFATLEEKGFITAEMQRDYDSNARQYRIPAPVIEAIANANRNLLEETLRTGTEDRDLIRPEKIAEKELFYADDVREDVESLYTYLEKEHFAKIQKRLSAKAMPSGVCVMLHGKSGSGKTETVYQLARKTNRALYHVDIGAAISQWVGGTEQNISRIFKKYAILCKRASARGGNIPILLFNEADALFGSRLSQPQQGAEVSENHIQSMLLDCMEKQNGILIATTNLAGNFDPAFERRFLFKIRFEYPSIAIKTKIWQSKIGWLHEQAAENLAKRYCLSGGEIENIARKATMSEVLTGRRSSVDDIERYCEKEKIEPNKNMRNWVL